ncbi:MAG TPA: hypothetical protein VGR91_15620 [Stellaceae bacterium]|nr:hypothetical protein [Stellaceae bacterium]
MPIRIVPLLWLAFVALYPATASGALTAAQNAAICGARSSCKIANRYDAGKSPAGSALTVLELRLALRDKPNDAPDSGCRSEGAPDGGREYWLLDGAAAPKRILKLCNDGYGAAGIGDDTVAVAANRLIHTQVGGSAWRWESTVAFTLSPWRAIDERDCSFNVLSPRSGTITDIDYLRMSARSIAKDGAGERGEDVGCPDWPADASRPFTPEPARGLLGAYNILAPNLDANGNAAKIPTGGAIGNCVPAMTTGGANGFVVVGKPAPAKEAAQIRVIAGSLNSLLIQVFDPGAGVQDAAARPLDDLPHLAIWTGLDTSWARTRLPLGDLAQITVDLNGRAYPGRGRKEAAPAVERWRARDAAGRPVIVLRLVWAKDTEFLHGAAIAYSQAEAGKRVRVVATTGFAEHRPLYMPDIISLPNGNIEPPPGNCRLRDGRLSIAD